MTPLFDIQLHLTRATCYLTVAKVLLEDFCVNFLKMFPMSTKTVLNSIFLMSGILSKLCLLFCDVKQFLAQLDNLISHMYFCSTHYHL